MAKDINEEYKLYPVPLNGRWIPAVDGTQLGQGDFQTLTNMRYGLVSPKSVTGMTKINSAAIINATYLKPRRGFQYTKYNQALATYYSYTLVQAWNAALSASKLYVNTTYPPSVGSFTATELWSDTAYDFSPVYWYASMSKAPDESMVYCNGQEACVYSGFGYRCAGFYVGALDGTVMYDYTRVINNVINNDANSAIMSSITSTIDANTMALWHMNNSTASDTTTVHTLIASGGVTFSTTNKFSTHSASFDGIDDYFVVGDHAEFSLTSTWTIDGWININSGATALDTIISHRKNTGEFYYVWVQKGTSKWRVGLTIASAGPTVEVGISSGYVMDHSTWYHIEVGRDASNYYLFINGSLVASAADTYNLIDYNEDLRIGATTYPAGAEGFHFKGFIDELRISNTCRHITNFDPPARPYGAETNCYNYVASTRPLKGITYYIGFANGLASSVAAYYWSNGAWVAVSSLVDGTVAAGKTLATNGTVSWTDTSSTAKPKMLNDTYAYWYLLVFTNIDTTTKIYHAQTVPEFQRIVDLWDGEYRPIGSFYKYQTLGGTTRWIENTSNVLNEDFVPPGEGTDSIATGSLSFTNVGALTSAQYLLCGFVERMTGLRFKMVQVGYGSTAVDRSNTNACAMTVSYWDGDEWQPCTGVDDGTTNNGASLGKSGVVTWDAPTNMSEFKYSVQKNVDHFYYYKISFDATLSVNTFIDHISGVSAQKTINGYRYPVMWQNRCVLLNEVHGYMNSMIISSQDTICVFNGSDAVAPDAPIRLGDNSEIMGGATLFTRFGDSVYEHLMVFKRNEIWMVNGTNPEDYQRLKISDTGCQASGTIVNCNTGFEIAPGVKRQVIIWQSDKSINMFDGNTIDVISDDISNYFDRNKSECINLLYGDISEGFFDEVNCEYHWLFCSGSATVVDTELVYDLRKKKWFKIDRGTGNKLQIGFNVMNSYGANYTYGGIDTGYILRLEYGTTFNATNIISTFRTGDISLGELKELAKIRKIKHVMRAKSTSTQSVTLTHYGDCKTTATSGSLTHALKSTTNRVVQKIESVDWGNFNFHSINATVTTSDENVGYEPLVLMLKYKAIHEELF